MSSLKEFYALDFIRLFNSPFEVRLDNKDTKDIYKVVLTLHMDIISHVKFCSLYVGDNLVSGNLNVELLLALLPKIKKTLNLEIEEDRNIILPDLSSQFKGIEVGFFHNGNGFDIKFSIGEEKYPASRFVNAPVLYFYSENNLTPEEYNKIKDIGKQCSLDIIIRGKNYSKMRLQEINPLAFISHDSRDKDVARLVAQKLESRGIYVWFDEFSLKIGDNLRQSIEKGIRDSKKCILLLTPNFLNNPGWTQIEFESIFQKNLFEGNQSIIPIWNNITDAQLYNYCPSLTGILGRKWNDNQENQNNIIREISLILDPL